MRTWCRLLCVPNWILPVSVCHMHAVLNIETPLVNGHRSYRWNYRGLRDGDRLCVFSVYELRRPEDHLHSPNSTSRGPPSGLQNRRRGVADFDTGKPCYRYSLLGGTTGPVVLHVVAQLQGRTNHCCMLHFAVEVGNKISVQDRASELYHTPRPRLSYAIEYTSQTQTTETYAFFVYFCLACTS